jgi:hypothetical protein
MKNILLTILTAGAFCLAPLAHAQTNLFGSPTLVPAATGLSNMTAVTATLTIPLQQWNLAMSATNPASTATGNVLLSLDGVHAITNGSTTFTVGSASNAPIVIPAFSTNVTVYVGFQLVPGPGTTNTEWATGTYNPYGH